jgi:pimeloyl-ACP methyl ester carboxylesterase
MSSIIDGARALLARQPRPSIIDTEGGAVECAVAGAGPAILALHGGAGGYDQGLLLATSAIGNDVTAIAPSRPGYLGTALAAGPSPQEQADLFAGLLDRLGVANVAVIAVSGGGPSAVQFALRHSDRCRALVLVSACTGRLGLRLPLRFHLLKLMARSPALTRCLLGRAAGDFERAVVAPQARAALLADQQACMLLAALQLTLADSLGLRIPGTENDHRRFSTTDGWPLDAIRVPVLAVHGTDDRIVAFEHGRRIADRVAGAELMAISGGEHVCLFTHREAIRTRTRGFLGCQPRMRP